LAAKWQKGQFLVYLDNLSPHEHNKKAELIISREMQNVRRSLTKWGESWHVLQACRGETDCFQPARPHNMGSGHLKEEWEE